MTRTLLVDNGSKRADSFAMLTCLAAGLSSRLGEEVLPASLAHSDAAAPPDSGPRELAGVIAQLRAEGTTSIRVVPLFLGPSGAIGRALPRVLAAAREDGPLQAVRAEVLCPTPAEADPVAAVLEAPCRQALAELGEGARVVAVDHGSPARPVAAVRDAVAAALGRRLADVAPVRPASMERREGPDYAFTDPLLEALLRDPDHAAAPLVLAMLFLLPGRHAGAGGDVDEIVEDRRREHPSLVVQRTPLLSELPGVLDLLAARARAASIEV